MPHPTPHKQYVPATHERTVHSDKERECGAMRTSLHARLPYLRLACLKFRPRAFSLPDTRH